MFAKPRFLSDEGKFFLMLEDFSFHSNISLLQHPENGTFYIVVHELRPSLKPQNFNLTLDNRADWAKLLIGALNAAKGPAFQAI